MGPPPNPIDRVLGAVVPRAVDSVDLDQVLRGLDINALLNRVDIDKLIRRVDVNDIVQRVDIDALLQRVDIDGIMQRVDIDALLQRADVAGIVQRAQVDAIVAATASGVGNRLLDVARRQLVGLDVIITQFVRRVFRRPIEMPDSAGGSVSGQLCGGASRLAAFLIDLLLVSVLGSMVLWVTRFMISVFTSHDVQLTDASGIWYALGYFAFFGAYMWMLLVLFGRTGGMAVVGIRVTADDESPLGVGATTARVIVYPFSFILGLGLVGIVVGRRHRALHDVGAHSLVRYDWGDRVAAMPAPLTQFLTRRGVLVAEPA